MGGTAAQARPTARSPDQAGKRAVGGAGALPAQPSGAAERVCKGAPASIRSPRPPPTPLGLSAPLAASPNPNPRSSLSAPLPSPSRSDRLLQLRSPARRRWPSTLPSSFCFPAYFCIFTGRLASSTQIRPQTRSSLYKSRRSGRPRSRRRPWCSGSGKSLNPNVFFFSFFISFSCSDLFDLSAQLLGRCKAIGVPEGAGSGVFGP